MALVRNRFEKISFLAGGLEGAAAIAANGGDEEARRARDRVRRYHQEIGELLDDDRGGDDVAAEAAA